jgi:hypothetical protein
LELPAVLQIARVSLRLEGALVVDTGTIQVEECQIPDARMQEHRLAVVGITQAKIFLVILPDAFNGDINILKIMDGEICLDGPHKGFIITMRMLFFTWCSL